MDNFVNFLLDYYVWILAVLGIIIVTIIGFLADSKQKKKKKEKEQTKALDEVKTVEALPDVANQVPINDVKNEHVPTVMDNVIGGNEINNQLAFQQPLAQPNPQPLARENNLSNQGQVTSNENNSNLDNLALNEQKPHFEPIEVNIPTQSSLQQNANENSFAVPKPINAVSLNQPVESQSVTLNPNMVQPPPNLQPINSNVRTQSMPNVGSLSNTVQNSQFSTSSTIPQNNVNVAPVQNYQNPISSVQQPIASNYQQPIVSNTVSNSNNLNQQVPNPIPTAPLGQVVSPIPSAPVNQVPVTSVQASPVQSQQSLVNPNIGISFVTGEEGSTNTSDDMWKL